ncbi:replication-associated recombination protein A [Ornithobacterium rhinotracheale]|uniref:Replication-associated recombination protein A n=2 Tax=Ornithobacterium rhinotracheale TaxID=28251 RepID=I3ZZK5_ORNRL|nr:replication-associated recombination protein A [Ornithobacterium rhinotracheale]AFL97139.1 AAA ATPase [Ornithobacterium rhinotracheale DSM 15997]AIP99239.1 ATPase AAA [Ornithobacterium rhinotracheale ORT-UMN 88]KGB67100.1 ATPase AAA [Ornithobacterium rhinotracheale H06-030791]MCK0194339.1 replication-associated recombination protein A [Ornithobacterium rhinotracheale]MCK0199870.1 replication-associated recombination protein A [Ornithobacterium rhinotracheale]
MNTPLAERMRPKTLEQYVNQKHLVGDNAPIKVMLDNGLLASMILWGPPGTGKTTLAQLLAELSGREFYTLSAINAGVKEVREVIEQAKKKTLFSSEKNPILFIDEVHRFNKSQQDSLLGAVEKGYITLIGATTENPSFEVVPALLSRCQVYTLKALDRKDLEELMQNAIQHDALLKTKNISLKETDALLRYSGGDARKVLNGLELVINSVANDAEIVITNDLVQKCIHQNMARYDKTGEQHYDIISAFIKSIRGSDPNAAVYWLARMIAGGEDLKFIARRLLILASEDIGNANPNALMLANNAFQAVTTIGYPEARIILSQCAVYLANSPKSNSTYHAINQALALVEETGDLPVPLHLRNAPTKLMKELDYGKDYKYAHSYDGNFVPQEYLPEDLSGTKLYEPGNNKRENIDRQALKNRWGDKYEY